MQPSHHVAAFVREAEDLLATVEEVSLGIDLSAPKEEDINQLFRAFHTLKGSGAMFGFEALAEFTHHLENALEEVRAGRVAFSAGLLDAILNAKDELEQLVAGGPAQDGISDSGRRLMASLLQMSASTCTADAKEVAKPGPSGTRMEYFLIRFRPNPHLFSSGQNPAALLDELRTLGECHIRADAAEVPVLDQLEVDHCYLGWEVRLKTDHGINAIRDVFIFVEDGAQLSIEQLSGSDELDARPSGIIGMEDAPPSAASPSAICTVGNARPTRNEVPCAVDGSAPSSSKNPARQPAARESMVRVPAERLDRLVSLVGELVMNQSRLTRVASRVDLPELTLPVEEIERLIGELRDNVLGIRMTPIGSTFARFKRLVHDLSADLGKEIDLVTEGADTELDKTVLDQLGEPLVHLIRNSLDHGIELPAERLAKGKPRRGTLRLSAVHTGSSVLVTIADDGRGLDVEAIQARAVENGLVAGDAELTEAEIFKLIFLPGFSTAKAVTSVSGRGVGMDVVKKQLEALRGLIQVASQPGSGTTITLTLPLTLAIIDGLLVEVGPDQFILPMAAVLENVEITQLQRLRNNSRNAIAVRGELVPYLRLRETFGTDSASPEIEKVVVVRHGADRVGLVVDRVVGSHQTVIQSLGRFYRQIELVSGATIMGDGRVALILDVAGLLRHEAAARSPAAPESLRRSA
jgi:two-component system, chemotaxis family, sensor kinase CheA